MASLFVFKCPGNEIQDIRAIITNALKFLNLLSFKSLIPNLWFNSTFEVKTVKLHACLLNSMWVFLLELSLEYFSQKS